MGSDEPSGKGSEGTYPRKPSKPRPRGFLGQKSLQTEAQKGDNQKACLNLGQGSFGSCKLSDNRFRRDIPRKPVQNLGQGGEAGRAFRQRLRRDIIKKPVSSILCELSIIKTNTELSELGERRRLSKDKPNQANSESKVSGSALGLREPSDKGLIRSVARRNNPSTNL